MMFASCSWNGPIVRTIVYPENACRMLIRNVRKFVTVYPLLSTQLLPRLLNALVSRYESESRHKAVTNHAYQHLSFMLIAQFVSRSCYH